MSPICHKGGAISKSRPNILWIQADDLSPHLSCYGESAVTTPNIDRLAKQGCSSETLFRPLPVCSPSRSAVITGMYQTSINAHHHRSYRYTTKNVLRDSVETLPALLRRQGIYTVLAHIDHPAKPRYFTENPKNLGKSDYNFEWDTDVYDAGGSPGLQFDEWPGFTRDQRFFAQVQLRGGKHRPAHIIEEIDRDNVHYPSYDPRHPVLIERWASYLASVVELDNEVGLILDQLESPRPHGYHSRVLLLGSRTGTSSPQAKSLRTAASTFR